MGIDWEKPKEKLTQRGELFGKIRGRGSKVATRVRLGRAGVLVWRHIGEKYSWPSVNRHLMPLLVVR